MRDVPILCIPKLNVLGPLWVGPIAHPAPKTDSGTRAGCCARPVQKEGRAILSNTSNSYPWVASNNLSPHSLLPRVPHTGGDCHCVAIARLISTDREALSNV